MLDIFTHILIFIISVQYRDLKVLIRVAVLQARGNG